MANLYVKYPNAGVTATAVSSGAFPLLAPNGTAAAPSYSFGGGTGGAGTGVYAAGTNILGFTTAGVTAGNITASQKWNIGTVGSAQTVVFNAPALQIVDVSQQGRVVGNGNDGYVQYQGAASADAGGLMRCYGSTHATKPNVTEFYNNSILAGQFTATGSFAIGSAALLTTATDGFIYIASCAGIPTGVPTAVTGRVATVYDTTNNKLYVYNGAWKGVTLA